MPLLKRPRGCLVALLALSVFGVVAYNLLGADPEGDGAGVRFVGLIAFGLVVVAASVTAAKLGQREGGGGEA